MQNTRGLFMPSIVSACALSFEFSNGRQLFKNLNFSLTSERTALIGPNGIGKTCLAQLLCGELEPTQGAIIRKQKITFFPQKQIPKPITVNEYLISHESWSLWHEQMLADINRETICTNLSGGEWMRVRLANTRDDQFLILDEPTNDLDQEGRSALIQFLKMRTEGILLISHDRLCLQLCSHFLELSNRGLTQFSGTWQEYKKHTADERERLNTSLKLATRERETIITNRLNLLTRQEKRNQQGAKKAAKRDMPKILIGARKRRAQATTGKINHQTLEQTQNAIGQAVIALNEVKVDPIMYINLIGHEIPTQKLVAAAKSFNVCFKNWIYQNDLNFSWRGPIRMAIHGKNGSGKSTLIKALMGNQFNNRGKIERGNLKTIYIDQQCSLLNDEKNILQNVQFFSGLDETKLRNELAKFLFTKDFVFQNGEKLSGGERLRAALACAFLSYDKPELLILDEPTNNLDLNNIEFLENLIRQFRGALIVVSHDETFLKNIEINEFFSLETKK